MRRKPRIGLALGGGGARGLAHIGVLKVFAEHGIPVDMIAGTSIGALIGAAFALKPDANHVETLTRDFIASPQFRDLGLNLLKKKKEAEDFFGQVASFVKQRIVINLAHSRSSLVGNWRVTRAVEYILEDRTFRNLEIPFVCVATDLSSGEEIGIRDGSLRMAVQASMSIPGFLPPVRYHGFQLVDGAVVAPVPVLACRELGADIIIAVDVGQSLDGYPGAENVVDIIFRTSTITHRRFNHMLLEKADLVIRPRIGHIHWAEFDDMDGLVAEGERIAVSLVPDIQSLIAGKSGWFRKLFWSG